MAKRTYDLYTVRISAHSVNRFPVPEQERDVYAPDERKAREDAIRRAHIDANVPPFRSLLRESWEHSTVTQQTEVTAR